MRSEQYYPHQKVVTIETLENVRQVMDKYGSYLTKLTYYEESAAINNLLTKLKQVDTRTLEGTEISLWILLIKNANNAFEAVARDFVSQSVKAMETQAATRLIPACVGQLTLDLANSSLFIKESLSETLLYVVENSITHGNTKFVLK